MRAVRPTRKRHSSSWMQIQVKQRKGSVRWILSNQFATAMIAVVRAISAANAKTSRTGATVAILIAQQSAARRAVTLLGTASKNPQRKERRTRGASATAESKIRRIIFSTCLEIALLASVGGTATIATKDVKIAALTLTKPQRAYVRARAKATNARTGGMANFVT